MMAYSLGRTNPLAMFLVKYGNIGDVFSVVNHPPFQLALGILRLHDILTSRGT